MDTERLAEPQGVGLCKNGDGRPVAVQKSQECKACYNRRWRLEHGWVPNHSWTTPSTKACSYDSAHGRVRRWRGSARLLKCIGCGNQAEEWSYNRAAENELTELRQGSLVTYSSNVEDYDPRCKVCHRNFDPKRQPKGTP